MTTSPSWARRRGTGGCPSTEVSPGGWHRWPDRGGGPPLPQTSPPFPSRRALAAPNLCDLNCLAVGHNFYYTFGRVLDGTRCDPGSPDLCVGGHCLSVGCDGILGSGSRPDACGRCGGGHESCLFVHRLFQGADPSSAGYFGYMNVTKIPAGATQIKVTDKSRNYLGRTCPVSVPVSPMPPMGAGRAGGAMPCHAVPVPPLGCSFKHRGFSEPSGSRGSFPEATGFRKG
ncbi:ATL5 protein, partial [Thinocorus orbignyianus]|nr:ATL5 protein [Thinocorus orbignyianus]